MAAMSRYMVRSNLDMSEVAVLPAEQVGKLNYYAEATVHSPDNQSFARLYADFHL